MPAQRAKSVKLNALGTNSPPEEKWMEGRCVGKEGSNQDGWMSQSNETWNEVGEQMSRKVQQEESGLDGAIVEERGWRDPGMEQLSLRTLLSEAFMCTVEGRQSKKIQQGPSTPPPSTLYRERRSFFFFLNYIGIKPVLPLLPAWRPLSLLSSAVRSYRTSGTSAAERSAAGDHPSHARQNVTVDSYHAVGTVRVQSVPNTK